MRKTHCLMNDIRLKIRRVPFVNKHLGSKCFSTKVGNILGIETSCDDTGCAIINNDGKILAEILNSQHLVHLRNGGIIPDIAQELHRANIEHTVSNTLDMANLTFDDINAIAVTVKPGLALSLAIGMKYTKHLARKHNKPLIPIHHMQAHALVARMDNEIPFPYLVLLLSGSHSLLGVVNNVDDYLLLGESIDIAPGEAFDKLSRRMKLRYLPNFEELSGGRAIELAASKATNPNVFLFPLPLAEYRDCNFSFSGLQASALKKLHMKEKEHNIVADMTIPETYDLCLAFLQAVTKHIVHRTQRAMEFCKINNLLPDNNKQLVVSGGVACNNFIFNALKYVCSEQDYKLYRPQPRLCTDNGVMIAWNGLEKLRSGKSVQVDLNTLDIEPRSPLGDSLINRVVDAKIKVKAMKLKDVHSTI